MRRAARLAVLYLLEALAALLALAIFAAAAVLWRLAEGPVDAEILRERATEGLLAAVGGDVASIGAIQLSFDPGAGALVITAREVTAARAGGEVIVDADRVETALALDLLLTGSAAPVRIAVDGGAFAMVRGADGAFHAGLGGPDAVRANTEAGGGVGALAAGLEAETGLLSRLTEIDLRGVDLQLVDAVSDLHWRLRDARAALSLEEGRITADLSGGLITSAGLAPVAMRLDAGRDLSSVFMDVRLRDLNPAAAAPRRGPLARLAGLDAPLAVDLVIDASVENGLRTAFLEVTAEPGVVRAQGRAFALEALDLNISLDAQNAVLDIVRAEVRSEFLDLDLSGRFSDFSDFQDALPGRADFALEVGAGRVDLTPMFPEPLVWEGVSAQGAADRAAPRIVFDRLEAALPGVRADFTGALGGGPTEAGWRPSIALSGPIEGVLTKADVLRHWPTDFALGARDWVRDSILAGELYEARLELDIPPEALARRALEDEHLSLAFRYRQADVRYVSTMTPLTGLSGTAVLRGDSLSLDGSDAAIGALAIDEIFVEIPRFTPKGATARFGGAGRGAVPDVLGLIDEPPLSIATNYGLDPEAFGGRGEMRFELGRPMLRHVPPEDVGYQVSGRFTDVTAAAGFGDLELTDGEVTISADPEGFAADGAASVAGARAEISWRETFGLPEDQPSSLVTVSTLMSARDLDRLGLPLRRFLDGAVGVEALVRGRGLDFSSIDLALDLEQAAVAAPADLWGKPAGEPAMARFASRLSDDGVVDLQTLELSGEGMRLRASARLAADGRLLAAEADRIVIDGRMDLSATAERPDGPDGPLHLRLAGEFLDAGELFDLGGAGEGGFVTAPLRLEAAIARVLVREVAFTGVGLTADLGPEGLNEASFAARTRGGGVDFRLAENPNAADGSRLMRLTSGDAGELLAAFAGYDNASGGALALEASVPPAGVEAATEGALSVTDFTLERMPLLARVLAAGSLEGLAGLLSGQGGIEFDSLETAFVWRGGQLEMRGARVAGPALGATWAGLVDFPGQELSIDGVIVPSYGANTVLGAVPVLGELLTSRRGEGVFGVTFSAAGPFDAARVVANPLSALAPGVLRRIFEGASTERRLDALEAAREAEADAPPPEPAPEPDPQREPQP
ncbi:MAG: AsmA-like C-terminal region-containing protein [Oceanicaulis sp.]